LPGGQFIGLFGLLGFVGADFFVDLFSASFNNLGRIKTGDYSIYRARVKP
jgi:hypothetical protein